MRKIVIGVCSVFVLLGEIVAMSSVQLDQFPIAQMDIHFNLVSLKKADLSRLCPSDVVPIEKYTYDFLTRIVGVFQFVLEHNSKMPLSSAAKFEYGNDFIEVPIGEATYLAAISQIFSDNEAKLSEESLNSILFAAQNGSEDAKLTIQHACCDSSYERAIAKGEYRAKECLKSRILGLPYKLDFYRPLAIDFPLMIASNPDWREPFQHIFPNISYLKSKGDVGYAYAAVQDVCCLYEKLKKQYTLYSQEGTFRRGVADFLLVASRVFDDLKVGELCSQFKKLSDSMQSGDLKCIDNAQGLFSKAAAVLEQYSDSD